MLNPKPRGSIFDKRLIHSHLGLSEGGIAKEAKVTHSGHLALSSVKGGGVRVSRPLNRGSEGGGNDMTAPFTRL